MEPFRLAGSDDGVQLVDEKEDLAFRLLDLLQHRFESFLEFPTELGSRHQGAHVEGEERFVLEPLGHVTPHDTMSQPSTIAVLPTAGLSDEHRVVFRLAAQDPDDAANLPVPTDDGIQLVGTGFHNQIAPVFFEGPHRNPRERHWLRADGRGPL